MNDSKKEYARIENAAQFIREKIRDFAPEIMVVLGSGLGHFAQSESVLKVCEIPYSQIPGMPVSTVSGHAGKFVFGYVGEACVMFMQGRIHLYEGYRACDAVMTIRIARLLGVKKLILTNAAGGVNLSFAPGDFMLITDHISSFVQSPLKGGNMEQFGTRFPDMSEVYSLRIQNVVKEASIKTGVAVKSGVYLQAPGPQYETPAEIRMMRSLGADAVGMSTVIEAIAAHHAGIEVGGISCVTNMAAGILNQKLSHSEVKEIADKAEANFSKLLTEIIINI